MAANLNQHDDSEVISAINTTPLVDVMLVLLIIFLITIPAVNASIKVELPRIVQNSEFRPIKSSQLIIDRSGNLTLDEKPVENTEQLKSILISNLNGDSTKEIYIYGDAETEFGNVSQVMEIARQIGINKINFMTDPKGGK